MGQGVWAWEMHPSPWKRAGLPNHPSLYCGSCSAGEFSRKLQRLSSNGTVSSSEELEEKDENAASFEQSA